MPQVGKVLSFSSIVDIATLLNNNKPLGTLEMGVLYSKIPETIKTEIALSDIETIQKKLEKSKKKLLTKKEIEILEKSLETLNSGNELNSLDQ